MGLDWSESPMAHMGLRKIARKRRVGYGGDFLLMISLHMGVEILDKGTS